MRDVEPTAKFYILRQYLATAPARHIAYDQPITDAIDEENLLWDGWGDDDASPSRKHEHIRPTNRFLTLFLICLMHTTQSHQIDETLHLRKWSQRSQYHQPRERN